MATITALGFSIFSNYNGRGVSQARRDIRRLGDTISRLDRLNEGISGASMNLLRAAAVATAPALIAVGQHVMFVAGATTAMAASAGAAGAIYSGVMIAASRRAFELKEANKDLNDSQAVHVKSVEAMKRAWNSFLDSKTGSKTLVPMNIVIQAITRNISKLRPVIDALHPVMLKIARAIADWLDRSDGLRRFIAVITKHGVPAFNALQRAARDVLAFLGAGFRAFAPEGVKMAETLERGAAALRSWAEGGGFQRFITSSKENMPAVRELFVALGRAFERIFEALRGMVPVSLILATTLARIVAALPIPVLQALIYLYIAFRIATVALRVAQGLLLLKTVALGVAMAVARTATALWTAATWLLHGAHLAGVARVVAHTAAIVAHRVATTAVRFATLAWAAAQWVLNAAMLANPIGLIVAAIAGLIAIVVLIATRTQFFQNVWDTAWSVIQTVAVGVFNAIQAAWRFFRDTVGAGWSAFLNGLQAIWRGFRDAIVAGWNAFWGVLRAVWQGFRDAVVAGWNAFWGALRAVWQAFRDAVVAGFRAYFNLLQTIWQGFRDAVSAGWRAYWNTLQAIWQAFRSAVSAGFRVFFNTAQNIWQAFRSAVSAGWRIFWNTAQNVWQAFRDAVAAGIRLFFNTAQNVWQGFRDAVSAGWRIFWNTAQNVWQGFRDAVSAGIRLFFNTAQNVWQGFRDAVSAGWRAFWNTAQNVWQGFRDAVTAGVTAFFNAVRNRWQTFRDFVSAGWRAFWNTLDSVASNIMNTIRTTIASNLDRIRGAFNAAKNFIQDVWGQVRGIVAGPIRFFVNTVYNSGLRRAWNATFAKVPGIDDLPSHTVNFASGGHVRGRGTSRSDSIPARLSNGEYVVQASAVRKIGVETLNHMNAGMIPGFSHGGPVHLPGIPNIDMAGVLGNTLGKVIDIAKGSDFLGGGGGIFGAIADFFSGAVDVARTVIPGLGIALEGFDWAGSFFKDIAKAAARALLNPFLDMIQKVTGGGDIVKYPIELLKAAIPKMIDHVFNNASEGMIGNGFVPFRPWQPGDGTRVNFRGVTLNRRTVQMMLKAEGLLNRRLSYFQGSYSNAAASAGTHSGGGAVDVGPASFKVSGAMRASGFAAWARGGGFGSPSFSPHVHGIAVGDPTVSPQARAQVEAFFRGRDGLAGNGPDNQPGAGLAGTPGGSGVARWRPLAIQALRLAGLPAGANNVNEFLDLMRQESGGNPNARNPSGATGLMQMMPGTFAAYRRPGLGGILNPLANMVASARYIKAQYGGRIPNAPYAMGGLVDFDRGGVLAPGLNLVDNATGKPEVLARPEMAGDTITVTMPITVQGNLDTAAAAKLEQETLPKLRMMLQQKSGRRP